MSAAKIKKGDKVVILSGKDKGKHGEVTKVMPEGRQGCRRRHQHDDPPQEALAAGSPGRAGAH